MSANTASYARGLREGRDAMARDLVKTHYDDGEDWWYVAVVAAELLDTTAEEIAESLGIPEDEWGADE